MSSPSTLPYVVVVTVNYNSPANTIETVRSVLGMTYPRFCIILVENGSQDRAAELVRAEFPQVEVAESPTNLGFSGGYNLGIGRALESGADAVLILNNDVLVRPDMLERLVQRVDSSVGAVGPLICYESQPDRVWSAGFQCHPLTLEITGGKRGEPAGHSADAPVVEVDYLLGCAMLLPKHAIADAGGFDTQFFLYYEDLDLSRRLQKAGYRLLTDCEALMWHKVAGSTGLDSPCRTYHLARSSVLFFRKHARGFRIISVLFWRTSSAIKKLASFALASKWLLFRAYVRGLADGWSGGKGHAAQYCTPGERG